ncbi:MAG: Pca regulon regulatory protein [Alphaproteobacteria bacterium ADurb.BinA280]|jgi:IclR family pca regulon transcriptional regulator|nr:helix-turn-helix domain-containing protein [Aquimonas sp.]OPZ13219.1 MAG: Pca regulon regulatory protein [Alphaproteobacteria bacterium ADurb.BinA280]
MSRADFEDSADYVQSLARGLSVLRAFNHGLPSATLSEVAQRAGLSRAVARRSLLTLLHLGYVGQRGRQFFLTPRVLELGFGYLSSLDLTEVAQHAMEQLSATVDESCSMAVLDGHEIVYVIRVPVRRVMSVNLGIGARLPAFATSMGRVLIADFPHATFEQWLQGVQWQAFTPQTRSRPDALRAEIALVRAQGFALNLQELEPNLCSVAVPLQDASGRVVAAINVGMAWREGVEARIQKQILPALRHTRDAIALALVQGGWQPHMHLRHHHD